MLTLLILSILGNSRKHVCELQPTELLKTLKIINPNNLIISHLNINSMNEFKALMITV